MVRPFAMMLATRAFWLAVNTDMGREAKCRKSQVSRRRCTNLGRNARRDDPRSTTTTPSSNFEMNIVPAELQIMH